MATVPLLTDEDAAPQARDVFDDIRATRQTDYINNFWRAMANDPASMAASWAQLKTVMGPGALDPLVKEMIYIAVSVANNCGYCVHSHTAAAKARGMSEEMHGELLAVIGMAARTNALATAMQVPVDEGFKA